MPTQPIVEYHPKEDSSTDKLAKVMMMEKLGAGIAGASEMLNKGIEAYQKIKANKQTQDLAAITAASTLVGGPDKLPVETRNKLPSILGVDFPRDEKGNVVLTPSAQQTMERAVAAAAEKDPETFGQIKAGMRTASRPPEEVALDKQKEETARENNRLVAANKQKELEYNKAKDDADRAEREEANVRTTEATVKAAEIRGPTAASTRAATANEPSNFWINKTTGEVLSKPAAEVALKEGEKLEDGWYNPTNADLDRHVKARRAEALNRRSQKATELDEHRMKRMDALVKAAEAKDPEGVKWIMDGIRDANAIVKKGGPGKEAAERALKWYNEQWVNKLGGEAPPEDHWWMILPQYYNKALETGRALLENRTGRGATENATGVKPVEAATGPIKAGGEKKAKSVDEWLGGK